MKKQMIALLMTVILLLGLMPVNVFAAPAVDDILAGLPFTADPGKGTTAWKGTDEGMLQSGNKGKAYSSSTLTLTFTTDAHISFDYKVSCEASYDKFTITHGSAVLVNGVSGEIDWTTMELDAAAGDVLTFLYKKDSSGDKGDDCVYLRNFSAGAPLVVTFHDNEETSTQNIYGGSGTLRANTFTREGKVFAGWAVTPGGPAVYPDGAGITLQENMDLYAVWAEAYTVTFDNQGSQTAVSVARGYAIGNGNIPTPNTITGYAFDGWYHGGARLSGETIITDNVTYTAKWKPITYQIQFNANGGTGAVADIQAEYDKVIALPVNEFVRTGYTFRGWGKSSYSSSPDYQPEETVKNLKNQQDSQQILYAIWLGNPVPVTVDLNYKGMETVSRTSIVGENYNYIFENGDKKFSSIADPKRTGYNFKGWFDVAEGGNAITNQYKFTAEDAEKGVTLYAQWAEAVTITFDANGGSCYTKERTIDRGAVCTLPNATAPSGKVFDGWYTEAGVKAENNTVFQEDTILYARYRNRRFTLSFSPNGGKGSMESLVCESGVAMNLPACTLTRDGYRFEKWCNMNPNNIQSWSSPKYYEDGADYTYTVSYDNSTVTLYAVWEKVEDPTPAGILTEAADSLTGYFTPKYGRDTNANEAVEALLKINGYEGITVSVKEAAIYNTGGGTAAILADGSIQYYFNPNMSGRGGVYFETTFILSKDGICVEKTWNTHMNWDEEKAKEALRTELNRIQLPAVIEQEDLDSLPHYLLKDGISSENVDYNSNADFNTWASITWTSSSNSIVVGSLPGYPYYAPYPVTVRQGNSDQTVSVTAHIVWNSGDNVELYKVFTITVKGAEEQVSLEEELQAKLDSALETVGLTDLTTGEKIDLEHVTGDIHFPTTRDIHIDGKYQPVTIISSNPDVIQTWDTKNAASAIVYRPLPGEDPVDVIVTMQITDTATHTVVSREIPVTVWPLTRQEIEDEIALMERVREHYFDGIRGGNSDPKNITQNLQTFFEVSSDEAGNLVWARRNSDKRGYGIIPVAMDGWQDTEQWRLFRSSNVDVITHENMLVTRQAEHKAVTITSWLSSETLGKYAEHYPDYTDFQKLANQPVTAELIVTGTNPTSDEPIQKTVTVTFTLRGAEEEWLTETVRDLPEGTTAADVFSSVLKENGYTYKGGSYIRSITRPDGTTLAELAHGPNSGWKYKVNGVNPSKVITQQVLADGDVLCFYYTNDYTKDQEANDGNMGEAPGKPEMPDINGDNIYVIVGDRIEAQDAFVYGSEWIVLGLARSDREVPDGYYENIVQYVREHIDEQGRLDPTKSTENSRLILSLTAAGYDVTNVGGYNLLQGLTDLNYVKKQGINGPIWALIALDSNKYEIPTVIGGGEQVTREKLIRLILDEGILDDSWIAGSSMNTDIPAPLTAAIMHRKPADDRPDPETIAMAIQALAPYYNEKEEVRAAIDKGLNSLSALQQPDGGYADAYGASAECNAQVIVALTALGINPRTDARFMKNGHSVVDALSGYYVTGVGFRHNADGEADGMATEQGYYALTAYHRYLTGKTALYDMSDVKARAVEDPGASGEENSAVISGGTGNSAGIADADKRVTPDTGDTTPVTGYGILAVISALMLAVLWTDKRKNSMP